MFLKMVLEMNKVERLHYDPFLKYILPSSRGSGAVLNPYFNEWDYHIEENLMWHDVFGRLDEINETEPCVSESDLVCYRYGKDIELYEKSKEHASRHRKSNLCDDVVIFNHPLYLHLSHMNKLQSYEAELEAREHLYRFSDFLNGYFPSDKVSAVLWDTIHHYAAATSLLLESGHFDDVFFTQYDRGRLVDSWDQLKLEGKRVYVCGGYDDHCLDGPLKNLDVIPLRDMWAIRDLILISPRDSYSWIIDPYLIHSTPSGFMDSHIISSSELVEKLGLSCDDGYRGISDTSGVASA